MGQAGLLPWPGAVAHHLLAAAAAATARAMTSVPTALDRLERLECPSLAAAIPQPVDL